MTRRALIPIAAFCLLGFLAPAAAQTKEVTAVSLCGADECRPVRDQRLLPVLVEGVEQVAGPAERSAFYRVRVRVDAEDETIRFESVVLPGHDLLQGEQGNWMALSSFAGTAYRKLTDDMRPLPAAQMPLGVTDYPPEARVVEVVEAPPQREAGGKEAAAWASAAALAALGVAAVVLARRRRHPRGSEPA